MRQFSRKFIAPWAICSILLFAAACDNRREDFAAGTIVAIGGDTHFGESYPRSAAALKSDEDRYRTSLSDLKPMIESSDFSFVNLETPLSRPRSHDLAGKDYVHWTEPEKAVTALTDIGVDAVGLANNHSLDQGEAGLVETIETLEKAKIASFGAGPDLDRAQSPLLHKIRRPDGREVTLAIFGMLEERANYRTEFKFYAERNRAGVAPFDVAAFRERVTALRKRDPETYVVAFPHWGGNYSWAGQAQVDLSRKLIDAGADLVIGQGAHTVQEVERYRRKWILYGIGNFLFQTPGRYERFPHVQPYSFLVELSFGRDGDPSVRLRPFSADNRLSGYRPRPASVPQTKALLATLQARRRSVGLKGRVVNEGASGAAIELSRSWTDRLPWLDMTQ